VSLTSDVLVRAQKKKGVSIIKPQWVHESIERGRQLPLIKEYLLFRPATDLYRLLVHASAEAEDGRYFDKSLRELDNVTFVRDRTGVDQGAQRDQAGQVEELEAEEENYRSDSAHTSSPKKTQRQLRLEQDWGLDRTGRRRSQGRRSDAESDAESERWTNLIAKDEDEEEVRT